MIAERWPVSESRSLTAVPLLHTTDDLRWYVLTGLCLQRRDPLSSSRIVDDFAFLESLVRAGIPLLPPGVVLDLWHELRPQPPVVTQTTAPPRSSAEDSLLPDELATELRRYTDSVLMRWLRDPSLALARAALTLSPTAAKLTTPQLHRTAEFRAGAFLYANWLRRAQLPSRSIAAWPFNPQIGDTVASAEQLTHSAWRMLIDRGPHPLLKPQYAALNQRLAPEFPPLITDAEAVYWRVGLATGTPADRLAFTQVQTMRKQLAHLLRQHPPAIPAESAGHAPPPDKSMGTIPSGGFAELSRRGTIESLVRSELLWMDAKPTESQLPGDLFDLKYAQQELLYYARDDNEPPTHQPINIIITGLQHLATCSAKSASAPFQRRIVYLGLLAALIDTAIARHGSSNVRIGFHWFDEPLTTNSPLPDTTASDSPTSMLQRLCQSVFATEIAAGTVRLLSHANPPSTFRSLPIDQHTLRFTTAGVEHPQPSTAATRTSSHRSQAITIRLDTIENIELLSPAGDLLATAADHSEQQLAALAEFILQQWSTRSIPAQERPGITT